VRSVRARQVVVAVPAPSAAPLVAPVAAEAAAALERLTYGPFVSVAAQTCETRPMPWDGLYAMATPGRAFDMFTNQAHALRGDGARRPGGSLMLFAGGHAAGALVHEPDEAITARFLADLHELYPQTRDVIAGVAVRRWPLGNVYARPGRHRLQAPLEGALGPHANLHLAGDYFAELGTMEAAARTGVAAAERVAALVRTPPRAHPRSDHTEVHHA
jgi:protoporphyrinogen/coproporphyrinogen III oxidase